jgi:hypothetical protein
MDIKDSRIKRLIAEHFTREEAERLADYPLSDPRVIAARAERKDLYWQYKGQGFTKKQIIERVRFVNKTEGYSGKKGIEKRLEDVKTSPSTKSIYAEAKERFDRDSEARGRYRTLRKAGFFSFEASELARMKNIPKQIREQVFKTKPWQAMIASHPIALNNMLRAAKNRVKKDPKTQGFSDKQIEVLAMRLVKSTLLDHRSKKTFNPYDWLRIEYKPKGVIKDYVEVKKAEVADQKHTTLQKSIRNANFRQVKGNIWE